MKASDLEKTLGKRKHKTTSDLKQIMATGSDKNPNFCLFLGSGASRSSGIRTAGDLIEQWRSSVYRDLSEDTTHKSRDEMVSWLSANASDWYKSSHEYSNLMEHIYPLQTNRRKFIESEVSEKIPSIGYAYLVRLAESGFLRTTFTTNFDDLLNEAFYQFSYQRPLVCAHDSSVRSISITSPRPKIIKLHGDYLFDDIKNTPKETLNLENNMKEKLMEFLKEYGLILSGYSGLDKSITRNVEYFLDSPGCLANGLFWCFRPEDEITPEALSILERANSFYVLTPGFDELMADFYSLLGSSATPFNSKLASDRASNVIESYLKNGQLRISKSKTIIAHLEALESDKNVSLLSDMMKELQTERSASAGLSDEHLLVYFEIERMLKERNPESALQRLSEELTKTADSRFKEILLQRRYVCSMLLYKLNDARDAVREMLSLDPGNFYIALNECSLLENRSDRISYLDHLKSKHAFSSAVFNRFAEELRSSLEKQEKLTPARKFDDVYDALNRSLELDPELDNWAWGELFRLKGRRATNSRQKELKEIVDRHLSRNAYAYESCAILFNYCKKFKTPEFNNKSLFEYLNNAYDNHFPRNYPAHLDVYIDACVEFDGLKFLRPILERARLDDRIKDDPKFIRLMMDTHYNVFRDLSGAISLGQDFLRTHKNVSIEIALLDLHLTNNEIEISWQLHSRLRGAIDVAQWYSMQAKIMEYSGRYQDAIDSIESIPDRRDFDERYTATLSYLELKMGSPGRAHKRCSKFLEERSFPISYESEIVNYEYAKLKDGRNVTPKRINSIINATDSEMVKAVCHSLLNNDTEALKTIREESEKRFSKIEGCLRWPALTRHQKELEQIHSDLLKSRRSLNEFPTI